MVDDVERMRRVYYKHPYNEEDKPLSYWRNPARLGLRRKLKDALPQSVKYRLILFLNWVSRNKSQVKLRLSE
ncbi:MAG: hypothetical protein NT043_01775 [Candidatus Bathyarchaeota archaeon]|jgi:hypothetical protein|nr:hypothetical protein [Candidatus Bathyarchaeota archaeon]